FLLPDGGRVATWTLLSHVACLLVAISLLTWLQIGGSLEDEVACVVVACVMYYSFLSAFLWLNVMSFDIWYTLRQPKRYDQTRDASSNAYDFSGNLLAFLYSEGNRG
ncbi:unnamed protein product, partial [Notodromas monacha]